MPIDGVGPLIRFPLTRITPLDCGIRPAISLSSVLFPQPLGPTSATNSRLLAANETLSSACTWACFER